MLMQDSVPGAGEGTVVIVIGLIGEEGDDLVRGAIAPPQLTVKEEGASCNL